MTKTTEELKREMYQHLEQIKKTAADGFVPNYSIRMLEPALEAHLEELRQERDDLRNRLQAFEFANKSAGEFLQAAQAKVKSQRQSIGQLKNDRNNAQALAAVNYQKYQKARQELSELRKSLMATPAQDPKENAPKMNSAINPGISKGLRAQLDGFRSGSIGSNGDSCLNPWQGPYKVEAQS